jgi:hypothetical protein
MKILLTIFTIIATLFNHVECQSYNPSMLFNLNRHGVREARDNSPREGGALLLKSAYDRLYLKGEHLRQKYPNLLSSTYKPNEIRVNSSSWERTITTSYGILSGLYKTNETKNIPVYSTPIDFDYTLYNYDKCPSYDTTWSNFQKTDEWTQKVIKYSNLTSYLNNLLKPKKPITLSNIFSTWDLYWIQQNRPEIGQLITPIDSYTYNTLTEATNWVETVKSSSRISGNLLGSSLLGEIKYRMEMFISKNPTFSYKWISSSAHYATLLNLLASMGYTGIVSQTIPDYNSVITFELYNKTGVSGFPSGWSIKIRYWDGLPNDNSIPIVLGNCIVGQDCEIDYDQFWSTYKVKNLQQWCEDCGNKMWLCKGANPDPTTTVVQQISDNTTLQNLSIAIIVMVSILLFATIINSIKNVRSNQPKHQQLPMTNI